MAPQASRAAEPGTAAKPGPPSEDTLKLIETVLDYIRSNLANIQKVWGVDSVQYKSASEIMNSYLDENLRAHSVDKDDIAELLANMSIDETKP
ncbi:hypothetical protein DV737_g624, partial [Chaetothyriales sp. CBS 132003]